MASMISIENQSEWPTWLIRWLVKRAAAHAGIKALSWVQRNPTERRGPWGVFGSHADGGGWMIRRGAPPLSDMGFRRAIASGVPASPVALLAYTIRAGVAQASGKGWPAAEAAKFVASISDEWPEIRRRWVELARKAKPPRVDRAAATRESHAERLAHWMRKAKLAQTKVRKYRRLLKAADRRRAAREIS